MTSPLKKEMRRDFNWMKRGCVSKRGEAKCIMGLWPGVHLGVWGRDEIGCKVGGGGAYFEFAHSNPGLDADFGHVENFAIKHTDEREAVRPLFRGLPDDKEGGIILGGPKLKRGGGGGGGVKWVDIVLFGKRDGVGAFEGHLGVYEMISRM